MKLITKEIEAKLPPLYATENVPLEEKTVQFKIFFPAGRFTFYVVEGSRQEDGDLLMFGYTISALGSDCDEWGYVSLRELEGVRAGRFGLRMERDLYFEPKAFGQIKRGDL